ncbi:DUF721 domain-containing protein [Candidatus Babeliales bacterium]|nr:DUF721 domain-containing protein [Candidatus Babeliales bacterium]
MAQQLKHLLRSVFKKENWKLELLSNWESVVGNLADKMRLEKIEGGTLHIGVYQSSWMHELYLLSAVLKKTINTHLGNTYITHIRLKYVEKTSIKEQKQIKTVQKIIYTPIVLTTKEEHALTKIKDSELQKALHNFLSRCHHQKVLK